MPSLTQEQREALADRLAERIFGEPRLTQEECARLIEAELSLLPPQELRKDSDHA